MNIKNINYSQIKNKIFTHKLWLTLVAIVFTLTSCVHNKKDSIITQKNKANSELNIDNNTQEQTNKSSTINTEQVSKKISKEKDVITIWIHGTRSSGLQDSVFKSFFYRKLGLHNISEYLEEHKATKLAKKLSEQDTHRFEFNNFCIYGWSGELSHKARKLAAKDLHNAILEYTESYKQKNGVTPKIRLITHSHGGNVVLNMAKINNKHVNKIIIHELILLACPVQQKTAHYISDCMFEKVYSLYSELDMLQVIDPQGLHKFKKKEKKPLFSERRFIPEEKITQAKIKVNSRSIMHVEFITEKFAKLLPNILQELDQWDSQETKISHNKLRCLSIHVGKNSTSFTKGYLGERKTKHIKKS